MTAAPREASPIDALADDYLTRFCRLSPIEATIIGYPGFDGELTDFSAAGFAARVDIARSTLAAVDETTAGATADLLDEVDKVSIAALREQLGLTVELADAGLDVGALNVIESPLQAIREIFDVEAADTEAQQEALSSRLRAVPLAISQAIDGLRDRQSRLGTDAAWPFPALQVREVIAQADESAALIIENMDRLPTADALALRDTAESISAAIDAFGSYLRDEIAPVAVEVDAVGSDAYQLFSRGFLGTSIDLAQTYAWGQEFLASVVAEQTEVAATLYPGASVAEALARLDSDERYIITGSDALQEWMQTQSNAAVEALIGTHFTLDDRLRHLECRIAPAASGGIYYTGPSEDLTRPGTMWWSVPKDQNIFHTWQERTTVYHEGVPGHHLQIGQAITSPELNRWRKLMSFTSGHGEGWALYAERLMRELGFLDDPGDHLGMLAAQRLRAARVVIDIGVHCGFTAPDEVGGGAWTYAKAERFLGAHCSMDPAVQRFELHRYLGWPGQAPSYAIGQRMWLQLREQYLAARPDATLTEFHTHALRLGGLGLDALRGALLT